MTDAKKVWMPDTFFRNEKQGQFHNIIQPNLYIRVFPNGDILYSIRYKKSFKKVPFRKYFMRFFFSLFRVSLTLSCPMTLELFPLDTQVCFLRVASCKCIFASIHLSIASLCTYFLSVFLRWLDHKRCHLYLEIT